MLTSEVRLTGPQLTVISIRALIALPGILQADEEREGFCMTVLYKNACEYHYGIESVRCQQNSPDQIDKHHTECFKVI